jgi:hypothetical protein
MSENAPPIREKIPTSGEMAFLMGEYQWLPGFRIRFPQRRLKVVFPQDTQQ